MAPEMAIDDSRASLKAPSGAPHAWVIVWGGDMEDRLSQIGKMEKQLQQWGAKLDDLADKVTTAGAKAKADERQWVAELRAKQQLAQARLEEFKAAGGDKWDTFKAGVESAYRELENAFKGMRDQVGTRKTGPG